MRENPFVFLRGTFYRWVELWPTACEDLARAPRVTAVGDLHIENFGTWRDAEGRLIWGVNDVDEAATLPYTSDLVRLATSAILAANERLLHVDPREISDAIVDGYVSALESNGQPIVLAERRRWLRELALNDLRDPRAFWEGMQELPRPVRQIPPDAARALETFMPKPFTDCSVRHRSAGVGSLGRPRYVALRDWEGGFIAREAKAILPSAATRDLSPRRPPALELIRNAVRARDPFWAIVGSWVVRRLAPDCSRIETDDLPQQRDERRLLRAMGWETANMHLATPRIGAALGRDLRARRSRWLERAAGRMADLMVGDWKVWIRHN